MRNQGISIFFLCILFAITLADERGKAVISTLQSKFYDRSNGLWKAGWWNSANSLEALIEYSIYSGDTSFMSAVDNTYTHTPSVQNGYYDDAQWWGIAWIRAYQITKQDKYRDRSAFIWNFVQREAWDNHCGGGVWWSDKKTYKNAITNELFLTLSTLLHQYSNNNTYLEWAQKEWLWFQHSGMINDKNLINDGLDNNCKNNGGTTWTYNQGVILGGLAYLAQFTKNDTLITIANKIADAVYDSSLVYTRGGVLKEPCESNTDCGGDGPQFKGIFIRYLGILAKQLGGDQKTKYTTWVNANADSIWNKDRTSDNECGLKWVGPTGTATATTQTSALDCFNAAILLS